MLSSEANKMNRCSVAFCILYCYSDSTLLCATVSLHFIMSNFSVFIRKVKQEATPATSQQEACFLLVACFTPSLHDDDVLKAADSKHLEK